MLHRFAQHPSQGWTLTAGHSRLDTYGWTEHSEQAVFETVEAAWTSKL